MIMSEKLFGRKLTLPKFELPEVRPSSAHYSRAFREAVWEWETEINKFVQYEDSADSRHFLSYLNGKTQDVALLHKGRKVKVVPLEAIWQKLKDGWLLVETRENHRPEIIWAAQNEPRKRVYGDPDRAIPFKGSADYAQKLGRLMRRGE